MKGIIFFFLTVITCQTITAQNVGIGTTEPLNKLQVTGNLLVNTPTKATNTPPNLAQIETIINAGTVSFSDADSTGRIYDPGGPSGNYNANITGFAQILTSGFSTAIEITVESMQLGTGDSLIIKESASASAYTLLAVGNGYTSTGKWIFNSRSLYITFKSNADASVGSGFSLLFKRLYSDLASIPNVSGVTGKALFFELNTGAFRSGNNTNGVRGNFSTAIGSVNTAIGNHATAIGFSNTSSGDFSIAMGYENTASGFASTALGFGTVASGGRSTTIGVNTSSLGYAGMAMGMYNNPILASAQTSVTSITPLLVVGNGDDDANRSNAMVVLKNGNVGIGTDAPVGNLHIRHAGGGGLLLENSSDNNKWRIYSASSDNNLTFYNNANAEVADIDDVTGTFNAISDSRLKKNIQGVTPVLPLLMQLNPTYYQFNWQQPNEQRQIGLLAQEAYQLFPELVSYNKEKDLYKMNYAGFSTVAIKAIQEQQLMIENQQKQIEELKALVTQLLKQQKKQP
jgi:Chaperone of endosialidase/Head domain of trimeric autotransporter adhesin